MMTKKTVIEEVDAGVSHVLSPFGTSCSCGRTWAIGVEPATEEAVDRARTAARLHRFAMRVLEMLETVQREPELYREAAKSGTPTRAVNDIVRRRLDDIEEVMDRFREIVAVVFKCPCPGCALARDVLESEATVSLTDHCQSTRFEQ